MATNTAPAAWWDEPDEVIATALHVLEVQAAQLEDHTPQRRPKRR